ncbi:hypothetical protein [Pseudorhodobacter sp.]|uniref:hypothetical protein n=1 Tax=Pseudorhodobacter sp. TaxID=1934400 RepID=UPI0026481F5F|nr:hypothetical protein [Pseudorhodobacter sp.]MDN5786193.1 hypothetical protein [Pseudorhodobacter sp.]
MTKRILIAAALTVGMAMPVAADPSVGLGLSIAFGNGRTEAGVGIRLFSTDRRDHAAASLGLDYMFSSSRIRPTVGAAYLGRNSYIGRIWALA